MMKNVGRTNKIKISDQDHLSDTSELKHALLCDLFITQAEGV
jgi:hypothetical protein